MRYWLQLSYSYVPGVRNTSIVSPCTESQKEREREREREKSVHYTNEEENT